MGMANADTGDRSAWRRALGSIVGLVLLLGALDLHDPSLNPEVYSTPTPVRPGPDCTGECRHVEPGQLLAPDHQPAVRPVSKLRLPLGGISSPSPLQVLDRRSSPCGPAVPRTPVGPPNTTRAPPAG